MSLFSSTGFVCSQDLVNFNADLDFRISPVKNVKTYFADPDPGSQALVDRLKGS